MAEDRLRPHLDVYLGKVEVGIYGVLAALLLLTAPATMVSAGRLLWEAVSHAAIAAQTLRVLEVARRLDAGGDSHLPSGFPFVRTCWRRNRSWVIGLIALIRQMLVISLELATLTKQ